MSQRGQIFPFVQKNRLISNHSRLGLAAPNLMAFKKYPQPVLNADQGLLSPSPWKAFPPLTFLIMLSLIFGLHLLMANYIYLL